MKTANQLALESVRFCDGCIYPGDGQFLMGTVSEGPPCFRCGTREGLHVLDPRVNNPRLSGFFSPEFVTCVELVPHPPIIWDTNGYYRELGLHPKATRKQIREAYQRLHGQDSVRLTYVASQLLDEEVRARYDATPLGSIFRDDEVETWIRRAKAQMVADYRASGEEIPEELLDDGELVDEMVLDSGSDVGEDVRTDAHRRGRWPYGYYVWQTPSEDEYRMQAWQSALSAALCRAGEHRKIAVGVQGAINEPWVVLPVGYRVVVFIHQHEWPTDELAEQAVSPLIQTLNQGPVTQSNQ